VHVTESKRSAVGQFLGAMPSPIGHVLPCPPKFTPMERDVEEILFYRFVYQISFQLVTPCLCVLIITAGELTVFGLYSSARNFVAIFVCQQRYGNREKG